MIDAAASITAVTAIMQNSAGSAIRARGILRANVLPGWGLASVATEIASQRVRRFRALAAAGLGLMALAAPAAGSSSDPDCTGSYGGAPPRASAALRLGIDPGIAGSAGGAQLPSTPDDPAKDLQAAQALAVPGHQLVIRLNRLFWSDGQSGIDAFKRTVASYSAAGFEVELQVRYHPPSGEAGDIPGWLAFVRHVVDTFGPNPRVVAMTITNEVNINFSPNTSDGSYSGAQDAMIQGIEAAHREAVRRHFTQLRFGFTYAYRFQNDTSFFSYMASNGGAAFARSLDFVGLDFYPGAVFPPAMPPGDSYRSELAQAAGVLRDCFMPQGNIPATVPIWVTEDGVNSGTMPEDAQAAGLRELVQAAHDYSGTFNITDYRWFNLRDSTSSGQPAYPVPVTFSSFGLLRDDYTRKPAFGAYHEVIAALGARTPPQRRHKHKRHRRHRHKHRR
jgi:hypothetical protein